MCWGQEGDGGRAEREFRWMKLSFSLLVLARRSAVSFLMAVQLGDEWVGVPWDAEGFFGEPRPVDVLEGGERQCSTYNTVMLLVRMFPMVPKVG